MTNPDYPSTKERLAALQASGITQADMKKELAGLVELASRTCEAPISLVNILDSVHQITKASKGWDISQMKREESFCQYTISDYNLTIVEDTLKDDRFRNSRFVTGQPNIRFYAAVPLTDSQGFNLGAVCVIDTKPRTLTEEQQQTLRLIADEVMARFELKSKEKQLQVKNRQLKQAGIFLENSSDMQVILDPKTHQILQVNEEVKEALGYEQKEFIGQSLGKFISDDQQWGQIQEFLHQTDTEKKEFTAKGQTKTGHTTYFNFSFTLREHLWYMTARDITERMQFQKKLQREQELSESIINSLPVNFFMYDETGNIIRWNDRLLKSTGYESLEIPYMNPTDFFPEEQKPLIQQKIAQVFEKGEATLEVDLVTKEGDRIPYLFTGSRFINEGKPYLIGTGLDITELRMYEQQLQKSLEKKEILLSEIHHRVKNNLAIISGLLQLEGFQAEDEKVEKALQNSQLRIQSMATVHELLYKSQDLTNLNFEEFVSESIQSVCSVIAKDENVVTFKTDIDPVQLNINQAIPCGLILSELIANAYTHAFPEGQEGTIEIAIKKVGRKITVSVADNGVGLPQGVSLDQPETMGFTLLKNLSTQLDAEITVARKQGTDITVRFNKNNKKGAGSSLQIT